MQEFLAILFLFGMMTGVGTCTILTKNKQDQTIAVDKSICISKCEPYLYMKRLQDGKCLCDATRLVR